MSVACFSCVLYLFVVVVFYGVCVCGGGGGGGGDRGHYHKIMLIVIVRFIVSTKHNTLRVSVGIIVILRTNS